MSMFHQFSHRHTPCTVDGINENVILSRDTKGSTVVSKEYTFIGRFAPNSAVLNGSLVVTDDTFLVQTLRPTPEGDKYCSMVKTNALIDVYRYGQRIDDAGDPAGEPDFILLVYGVIAYAEYVTASLRQQDIGLLATTEYILVVQKTVDVKKPNDPSLHRPDRVVLNGRNYQVDVVDDMKFPNLYHIQLSVDYR
jgi:hypothetical protein